MIVMMKVRKLMFWGVSNYLSRLIHFTQIPLLKRSIVCPENEDKGLGTKLIGNQPYITDNGGYIIDCEWPQYHKPADLEKTISDINGVVEVGLFVGICDAVILASSSGVEILVNPDGRLN